MPDELQQFASSPARSTNLARRRCDNHIDREAAAQCPKCKRFFCRECVTEHAGKVICADCLAKLGDENEENKKHWSPMSAAPYVGAIVGMTVAWLAYYYFGRMFLSLPHEFHEGTMW